MRTKYYFKNAEELTDGIVLLANELGIALTEEQDAELVVTVNKTCARTLTVTLDGGAASITFGDGKARFFRGLAILVGWVNGGERKKSITEQPLFKTNGAMVDMSRNAVMNVETVKTMLRKMALMGLNTYMLYTEDTYELGEHPYFGYMRGRYTREELKELDAYALKLGIELIPCIQMLGHLATHLRWTAANPYKDTADALLVGAEETYALIDDMLRTVAECFTTRRLHVGMDETHDLGTGKYLDANGYRERQDIYFAHLERIKEMVIARGFKPMMWSDMFFRLAGKGLRGYKDYDTRVEFTDEVIQKTPKGVQQVFWDYYNADEEFYAVNIDKHHRVFGKDTVFAGGIWTWSGHCPLYSRSLDFTVPALDACRKKGVEEIFATIWHNGSEGSLIMGLAGLAWYADYDYKGGYDAESIKECFARSCGGVSYDELMLCELPEHPDGGKLGLTRAFLYNDPLIGLADKHLEGFETRSYYKDVTKKLERVQENKGIFAPACDTILKLSSLLEHKADFGIRLKAAYDAGDRETLKAMADECDTVIERIKVLRESHRASWMTYNKPFGWEVHDIRYGGLLARFDTVKERLAAYLAGELERIEELEAERLRLDGQLGDGVEPRFHNRFLWMKYGIYATAGAL